MTLNRDTLFIWLLGTCLAFSLLLVLWVDSPWEQVFYVAGNYLLLAATLATPLALFLMYRGIQRDEQPMSQDSILLTLLVTFAGTPLLVFTLLYAGVLALNVWLPPQHEVLYQGFITDKEVVRGRSTTHYVYLDQVDQFYFELRFKVSKQEYENYQVGDKFRRQMTRGGLNIDYRLGF